MTPGPAYTAQDLYESPAALYRRVGLIALAILLLAGVWRPLSMAARRGIYCVLTDIAPGELVADIVRSADASVPPNSGMYGSSYGGYAPFQFDHKWCRLEGSWAYLHTWRPVSTFTPPLGVGRLLQMSGGGLTYQHTLYSASTRSDLSTITPIARYQSASSWLPSAASMGDHDGDGCFEGVVSIDQPNSSHFDYPSTPLSDLYGGASNTAHCYAVVRFRPDGLDLLAVIYTSPRSFSTRPYLRVINDQNGFAVQIVHGFAMTDPNATLGQEFGFDQSERIWKLKEGEPDRYLDVAWLFPTDDRGLPVHIPQDVLLETFVLENYPPPDRINSGRQPEQQSQITPSWMNRDK